MSHWRRLRRATVTNAGESYEEKPTVTVSEPAAPKQPAQAVSELDNGAVSTINLDSGGNFYSNTPNVTLSAPDSGGTQATATAIINNGEVTKISIVDSGSGYSSPPQVIVPKSTDPKSDFAAQLTLDFDSATGTVTAINVVDSGRFFDEDNPPAITISPPFGNRDFEIGEDVTISGIDADSTAATVTGEVAQWVESSGKLTVIHIANDTGDLVEPTANSIVTAVESGASSKVTKVETPAIAGDISDEFDEQASDFLDFSESNPFGEPEAATVAQEAAAAIVTAQSTTSKITILGNKSQPSFIYPLEFKVTANGVDYQFNATNNDDKNFFIGVIGLAIPGLQMGSYLKAPIVNGVVVTYEPQVDGDTIKLAGSGWTHVGITEGEYDVSGDRQDLQAGDSAVAPGPAPAATTIILQGNKADPSFATNKTYTLTADDTTYTYGPTTNANRNFYQGLRDLNVPGLEVGTYSDSSITFGVKLEYTPQDSSDTLSLLDTTGWPHIGLAIGEYVVGTNTFAPPPPPQGLMSDSDYNTAISQSTTSMIWDSAAISIGTSTIRYEEKYNFTGNTNVTGIPRQVVFGDNGRKIFYLSGGAYSNSAILYGMNLQTAYDLSSVIDSATSAGILDLNSTFANILDSATYTGQYDERNMLDVFFNPNGTKMWITGNTWDTVIQFALDSAWNPFGSRTIEHKIATGYMGALQTGTLINGWVYDSNLEVSNWYSNEWIDSGRALVSSSLSDNGKTIKQEFSTPYDISTVTTSFTASSIGDNPHTLYSDSDSDGKSYAQDALKLAFSAGGRFNHDGTERYFIHRQFDDSAFDAGNNGLNGWRVSLIKTTLDTPYDITTMRFTSQTELTNLSDSPGAPTTASPSGALTFHPDGSRFYWMSTGSNDSATANYSDWNIYEFSGRGDSAGSSLITTPDITVAPMIQGTYVLDSAGTGQQQQTSTQDSAILSADSAISGESIFSGVTSEGIKVGGDHPDLLYQDSNLTFKTAGIANIEFKRSSSSTPNPYGYNTSWYSGNQLGWSVAITKDLIVSGMPNSRRNSPGGMSQGSGGYLVALNDSEQTLMYQTTFTNVMDPAPDQPDGTSVADATTRDQFGKTVAASGKTFAISSPYYDNGTSGYTNRYGAVWVKSMVGMDSIGAAGNQLLNNNEMQLTNAYSLMAPSVTIEGEFGADMDMDSDFNRLVIGEAGRNTPGSTGSGDDGRVYSYRLTDGAYYGYIDNPFDGAGHQFGRTLALSGDYLAVADQRFDSEGTSATSNNGAVHIFDLSDSNRYVRSVFPDTPTVSNTYFGRRIALEGTNLSVITGKYEWYVFDVSTGNKIAGPIMDPRANESVYTTEGNVSPDFVNVKMSGNIAALMSRDRSTEAEDHGLDSNGESVKRIYFYDVQNLHNNDSSYISYISRPANPTSSPVVGDNINWGNANGTDIDWTDKGYDIYGHNTLVGAPAQYYRGHDVSSTRYEDVGELYFYGEIADSAGAADFRPGYEAWRTPPPQGDVSTLVYDSGQEFEWQTGGHPGDQRGMRMSPDGSTFVMKGPGYGSFRVYSLTTPYDLTTMSRDTGKEPDHSAMNSTNDIQKQDGFAFNDDWTKIFTSYYNSSVTPRNSIHAFDISGADSAYSLERLDNVNDNQYLSKLTDNDAYWHDFLTGNPIGGPYDDVGAQSEILQFNNDGTRLYISQSTGFPYSIAQIDLDSAYVLGNSFGDGATPAGALDLREAVWDGSDYGTADTNIRGVRLNHDGTRIYAITEGSNIVDYSRTAGVRGTGIYQFDLATPWDVTTSSWDTTKFYSLDENIPNLSNARFGLEVTKDYLYVSLNIDGTEVIRRFNIAAGSSATTTTQPAVKASVERFAYDSTQEFTYDSTVEPIYGLELSPDGKTIVMKDAGINDWRAYSMSTAWDLTTASRDTSKEPTLTMDSTSHKMKEFGMTFNDDWTKLYTTRIGGSLDIYKNEISQFDISGGASTYSIDRIDDALDSNREDFWGTLGFFATVQDQTGFNRNQRPDNIQFGDSGRRLYWTSKAGSPNVISQWHLSAPYTIDLDMYDSGALYYPAITNGEVYTQNLGMHVSYDGTRLYMLANSSVVDSAMHPGSPDRGIGIYQFDLADSWDITSATWDSSKYLQIENIPHGNVTDATGDIFSTKDYLYTALTIDGTTKLRRYSIVDSVPPPPRSGSDSDGNGFATSLNWTVTVDTGPLYEDSATEGNVFYLEGDNSDFNY